MRHSGVEEIFPGLFFVRDGINTAVLVSGGAAVVVNPGTEGLGAALRSLGVERVEKVLFTHHRRELADSLGETMFGGAPEIIVPEAERELFETPSKYWGGPESRWMVAFHKNAVYHVTHTRPLPVTAVTSDGCSHEWRGFKIETVSAPGCSSGAVCFIVSQKGWKAALTGDLIHSPGKVIELYALQRGDTVNGFTTSDYHGFLGAREKILESLRKILSRSPDCLLPSRGVPMRDPVEAVRKLERNFSEFYLHYVRVSALRWYFVKYFEPYANDKKAMPMQRLIKPPPDVENIHGTTWILKAASGRALLLDPASEGAVAAAEKYIADGKVSGYDAVWLSHYHCDHIGFAPEASEKFQCPVIADAILASSIENPSEFFLPCQMSKPVRVDRKLAHGESWKWENFTFTSFHLPGQSYYHGGLFASKDGGVGTYFFAGDSFSPTGIDDYCSWNRNFLGEVKGYEECVRLVSGLNPDIMFNQHIEKGFHFSKKAWAQILGNLRSRRRMLSGLIPWEDPNFALDESWVSVFPYESAAEAGDCVTVQVRVWNHLDRTVRFSAEPASDTGWIAEPPLITAPAAPRMESRAVIKIKIPADCPGGRFVVPVRITFDGINLGSFREFIINVTAAEK
jgi:glyoxylase-like metal-dependent hydrolase (beta-lactamase superfamily II)